MEQFPFSLRNSVIPALVYYVSKRIEVVGLPTNNSKVVIKLVYKLIFTRLGTP